MCCFCGFKGLDPAEGLSHHPAELHCVCGGPCTRVSDTRADLYVLPPGWINLFISFQFTAVYQYIRGRFWLRVLLSRVYSTAWEPSEEVSRETSSFSQEGHICSLSLGKTPHFKTARTKEAVKAVKYVYLLFLNVIHLCWKIQLDLGEYLLYLYGTCSQWHRGVREPLLHCF